MLTHIKIRVFLSTLLLRIPRHPAPNGTRHQQTEHLDRHLRYFHFSFLKAFREIMKENQGGHVLDLACGTAILARKAKRIMPDLKVVGLDLCENMLVQARRLCQAERLDISLVCSDAGSFPSALGCCAICEEPPPRNLHWRNQTQTCNNM